MDEKKIKTIIVEYKSRPNKDLLDAMKFLQEDFEKTKKILMDLTNHLDGTEMVYNRLFNEYKERTKK